MRFEVIPVMDLMGGKVVRAKRGERHAYQPIVSKLCNTAEPIAIARALLQLYPFESLYIADLDAIQGRGNHIDHVAAIREALPEVDIWIDAGLAELGPCRSWLDIGTRCVIGSESQQDVGSALPLFDAIGNDEAVLSLDYSGGRPAGPKMLFESPEHWPMRVIGMTLGRVGSYAGPDIQTLQHLRRQAPKKRIYAAGGVRNFEDIEQLKAMCIDGALVASALHDGIITGQQLARLAK